MTNQSKDNETMTAGWLKTRDAREYISIGTKSFEKIVASGQLVYVRLPSGHRRFHTTALDEYMRQYEVGPEMDVRKAADAILEGL